MWAAWGVPVVVVGALALLFVSLIVYLWLPLRAVAIPIKGRHMVVTGGSSGIGLEIAKLAAAEGARVSLVARDERKLADAKNVVTEYCRQQVKGGGAPAQVNTYSADVKNFGSVNAAIEAAVSDSGVIGVLVLSHGISVVSRFEDQTVQDFDHVIDTNLKGNIHTIKAALPHIKASNGAPASISMFSSQAGQVGVYGYAAYSASKFALRGLAECLQQELIDRNIRLSLVYPPDTMTPGYVEDQKTMPELTAKLSGSSKAMDSMSVARATLAGLKAGNFHIYCNLEGFALSLLCSGMGPQPSLWKAMAEVLIMGVLRVVALFIQRDWYAVILQSKPKEAQAKKTH
ncbi:hypothetical protein KC19_11G054400 [Ceratodon purpureus]|uniref:3-dehydrosphinganine reductase n=2 Tax=Ceratodon purpureus TaxID=3225 RepID=A0A8T0GGZ0_CERPU|nr:hypothetical protein KC19_11G054400 [Ceratodon purpureus]